MTLVIYPLKNQLYRVQVRMKHALPLLAPLFDGAVVDATSLPFLVRETAVNAGRMLRAQALGSEVSRVLGQILFPGGLGASVSTTRLAAPGPPLLTHQAPFRCRSLTTATAVTA